MVFDGKVWNKTRWQRAYELQLTITFSTTVQRIEIKKKKKLTRKPINAIIFHYDNTSEFLNSNIRPPISQKWVQNQKRWDPSMNSENNI